MVSPTLSRLPANLTFFARLRFHSGHQGEDCSTASAFSNVQISSDPTDPVSIAMYRPFGLTRAASTCPTGLGKTRILPVVGSSAHRVVGTTPLCVGSGGCPIASTERRTMSSGTDALHATGIAAPCAGDGADDAASISRDL